MFETRDGKPLSADPVAVEWLGKLPSSGEVGAMAPTMPRLPSNFEDFLRPEISVFANTPGRPIRSPSKAGQPVGLVPVQIVVNRRSIVLSTMATSAVAAQAIAEMEKLPILTAKSCFVVGVQQPSGAGWNAIPNYVMFLRGMQALVQIGNVAKYLSLGTLRKVLQTLGYQVTDCPDAALEYLDKYLPASGSSGGLSGVPEDDQVAGWQEAARRHVGR